MRTIGISDKLDDCYRELEEVKNMPEGEVCEKYNADSKSEIIAIIYEEIAKPQADRAIPCIHMTGTDAIEAFKKWASKEDKTQY